MQSITTSTIIIDNDTVAFKRNDDFFDNEIIAF